jgi:hypothetical protein
MFFEKPDFELYKRTRFLAEKNRAEMLENGAGLLKGMIAFR